jgi:hypothetical protein
MHETHISTSDVLVPGHEFELYGHRWRTVGLRLAGPRRNTEQSMCCDCIDSGDRQPAA